MKPVVIGILYRRRKNGQVQILTQERLVQNHDYDPLYDHTLEVMGETLHEGESVLDALIRGIQEECGVPEFEPLAICGADGKRLSLAEITYSTGKDDYILEVEPFCFVQQLGKPQPWIGPVFLVHVDQDFEPDQSQNDGEAGEYKWCRPRELLNLISEDPGNFMGLHMPALKKAAKFFIND
ncbi:MAG: NUDIX domain-containing protein [bacterium]|nr:NUDIX domain-containing protein [bacterium]